MGRGCYHFNSSHPFSLLYLTVCVKWCRTVQRRALQITTRIQCPRPARVPQPCPKPSIAIHSFTPHGSSRYHHLQLRTELYPPAPPPNPQVEVLTPSRATLGVRKKQRGSQVLKGGSLRVGPDPTWLLRPQRISSPSSPPHENVARKWPSGSQDEGPLQTPITRTSIWYLWPPEP